MLMFSMKTFLSNSQKMPLFSKQNTQNVKTYCLSEGSKYAAKTHKKKEILHFWKRIDELNVWNWNKRYEDDMAMTDGYTWEVKLRNRDDTNENK